MEFKYSVNSQNNIASERIIELEDKSKLLSIIQSNKARRRKIKRGVNNLRDKVIKFNMDLTGNQKEGIRRKLNSEE